MEPASAPRGKVAVLATANPVSGTMCSKPGGAVRADNGAAGVNAEEGSCNNGLGNVTCGIGVSAEMVGFGILPVLLGAAVLRSFGFVGLVFCFEFEASPDLVFLLFAVVFFDCVFVEGVVAAEACGTADVDS